MNNIFTVFSQIEAPDIYQELFAEYALLIELTRYSRVVAFAKVV